MRNKPLTARKPLRRTPMRVKPKNAKQAMVAHADRLIQQVAIAVAGGACQFPCCNNEPSEGHHIIHRRNHALRWVIANVPALCHYHHGWDSDASKKSKLLQGLIERMGGQANYDALVLYGNTADSERPEDAINRLKKELDKQSMPML